MIKKITLWVLVILLIACRYYSTRPVYNNGDNLRISGVVVSDPIRYSNSQLVKLAGLRVYTPLYPNISYGDKLIVEGVVDDGQINKAKVVKVEERKVLLSGLRNSIVTFYQNTLPEPEAGLLGGIVLGGKGALLPDFYNQTKLVGLTHVVVASGTNITFVVVFLVNSLTVFFARRRVIPFVILGIILYLFVSGFDAPLIRAAIMSTFLLGSQEVGRVVKTWRLFFITIALMLVYNPDWAGDIGFILSFVSTASLILFEKRIRSRLNNIPSILKESLSTSLAAQIGVAPIIFVTFGHFNILSPLINMLVLPVVAPIMILGAIGGTLGIVIPTLGRFVLYLSYPLLLWFTNIVKIFSS